LKPAAAPIIKYCRRCVMPATKPDLRFDAEGVCSACRSFEQRVEIDWADRRRQLQRVLEEYRPANGGNYDCIVPVSGGKDSHFQVLTLLELGANPLCVTATTDQLSAIGRRNIENIKKLGVDYIEVSVNPVVRRRINRLCLEQVGDISWPEHVTIFTIPVRVATQLGIRLIVWGENPQNEYGGPSGAAASNRLDRRWLEEFGGLLGLRVSDLVGQAGIEERHLVQYTYPSESELQRVGVAGVFLGYYVPWDGLQNAVIAQAHGFETYAHAVEGALFNYENVDNHQTGIHDYFKYLKFAFGRVTDHACLMIRRGRLLREHAISLVKKLDGRFPWTYLGMPIEETLGEIDMSLSDFVRVCDRFTNKRLFVIDADGRLVKDRDGNLTRVNDDNAA
jgi:N-acetyl sugar amidotransferase